MIYVAIQTMAYTLLLYSMIGFEWNVGRFFWFYYFIFMCFVYFTLYGMMFVALTPGLQVASIASAFFLSFWNLFSGFLLPRPVSQSDSQDCFPKLCPVERIMILYGSKFLYGGDGITGARRLRGQFMGL